MLGVTVYIDEIFFINLLMDALVVWSTGWLMQQTVPWNRLLIAALIGACYGVIIMLPQGIWLANGAAKMLCALLMVWVAFGRKSGKVFFKCVIYLYLVSFVLGGATIALMYFGGNAIVQTWSGIALIQVDFCLFWLFGGAVLLLFLVNGLQRMVSRRLEQPLQIIDVYIKLRGRMIGVKLLVDSGNCLTDTITGKPVTVVQTASLRALFTPQEYEHLMADTVATGMNVTKTVLALPDLAGRVRLIPYQSVGYQGLLLGIRTDTLQIDAWGVRQPGAVIALTSQPFSADGMYQGIISPAYIEQKEHRKGESI